ncbi:MAG: zinc-dependent metalloprotease [Phycisphaeraceae bacterium]|nr:zinc-dependent metalloprotease [Phycisphaeraceae bacterium]
MKQGKKTMAVLLAALVGTAMPGWAQEGGGGGGGGQSKPDFPPFKEVSDGYEKVVSTAEGESLYTLWKRDRDGQLLAELPRGYQNQKHFFAMTMPTGELFAGLQLGAQYVYWKRFDKRMALIAPNTDVRSTGDKESRDSLANHFTDRVLVDVPIVCMGPNGQPVIDMDELLVGRANVFYGGLAAGANPRLATFAKAPKAFPENVEIEFSMPVANGQMKSFHYSISVIKEDPSYKPRRGDTRVGYFQTSWRDLGKFKSDEVWTRYIQRWNLQKKDPSRKMSPPEKPIVYYVEHTVPARYRRWVKEGTLWWNKAFEQVGIVDAIEVYYQDKETGAHMDKDPEDVRYNFIRWLSNDIGTAIGPSRAHPITGQILDADIVLTDGWIRHFWYQANELMPQTAMEGFSQETLSWLDRNPRWDPRIRLASPEDRDAALALRSRRGVLNYGGAPAAVSDGALMETDALRALAAHFGPNVNLCMASHGMARNMALMGVAMEAFELLQPEEPKDEGKKGDAKKDDGKKKEKEELIDGIPEWFVGPALAHLTVHEVGHTLGLRHNFKSSSIYTLAEINSPEMKGKCTVGSVMDYTPVNINMDDGKVQGDWNPIGIGPYDLWAIEYGYTFDDPKEVAKRSAEPLLTYGTDEDTGGPDPLARRYDFSANPMDYAKSRMRLVKALREKITDKFVKDGQSWARSRRGYQITLSTQMDAVSIMANWVGGAFVSRSHKGDPGAGDPITPVPASQQRAALKFAVENTFYDDAFGLSPDLLRKMTIERWSDGGTVRGEPTWPVHDQIMGVQTSTLTMLMNPSTLRRVYDNEFLVPAGEDALTLPELMDTVSGAIWSEIEKSPDKKYTAREPMISSLRRNLQREHMDRLIDLSITDGFGAASKPISNLATSKLRDIKNRLDELVTKNGSRLDPYTHAHLDECKLRIEKALEAQYIRNADGGMGGFGGIFFGQTTEAAPQAPAAPTAEDAGR